MSDDQRTLRERINKRIADALVRPLAPTPSTPTPAAQGQARVDSLLTAEDRAWAEDMAQVARRQDAILNPLTQLGSQSLDRGSAARPDTDRTRMDRAELEVLYRFDGLSRRINDIVPFEATREGWKVILQSDEKTEQDNADVMADENQRLRLVSNIAHTHELGRLYGGGHCLVVVTEDAPRVPAKLRGQGVSRVDDYLWTQPLDLARVKSVDNLLPLDATEVNSCEWEGNVRSHQYGRPSTWLVTPRSNAVGMDESGVFAVGGEVHHSRMLYFPGHPVPRSWLSDNDGIDDSITQALYDATSRLIGIGQAGSLLAQDLKHDVLKIKDFGKKATGDDSNTFFDKMKVIALSRSLLGMILLGEGDEYFTKPTNVAGWKDLHLGAQAILAAVSGLPVTLLFGQAPAGLSTDDASGRVNWERAISAVHQRFYLPQLTHLYSILFAAKEGPTKGQAPESWRIAFGPLSTPTPKEQAEIVKMTAETDQINMKWGIYSAEDVTASRYGLNGWSPEMLPVEVLDIVEGDEDIEAVRAEVAEDEDEGQAEEGEAEDRAQQHTGTAPEEDDNE